VGGGGEGAHVLEQIGETAADRVADGVGSSRSRDVAAARSGFGRWCPASWGGDSQIFLRASAPAAVAERHGRAALGGAPGHPVELHGWNGHHSLGAPSLAGGRRGRPPRPWGGRPRGGPLGRRWEGRWRYGAEAARFVSRERDRRSSKRRTTVGEAGTGAGTAGGSGCGGR
jgi:hypothetical protein